MDFDKYYIQKGDFYSMHFINKNGYSENEIRNIFSEYGNVLSVKLPSGINGFCFIRYKSLDEVIACLKGLQNHGSIRILKERSKLNAADLRDGNSKEGRNSYQRNSDQNEKHQNTNRWARNLERRSPTPDRKVKDWNKENLNSFLSKEINQRASSRDSWSDTSSSRSSTTANHPFTSNDTFVNANTKGKTNLCQLLKLRKLRGINSDTFSPLCKTEATGKSKKMLDNNEISLRTHKENFGNFSPVSQSSSEGSEDCSMTTKDSNIEFTPRIVPASEVIVTNIHSKYGIHYILHLFESFNPIAATLMKTIFGTSIRYCHVYFEKEADAVAVKSKFNNYSLENQKLVVMQPKNMLLV